MVVQNHDKIAPVPAPETQYTLEEAAAISRRSTTAMRQLRVKGKGPRFRKIDGRLLVSASELQRWLNGEDTVESPAPAAPLAPLAVKARTVRTPAKKTTVAKKTPTGTPAS
jgi:Helix-turn-helix domain